MNIATLFNAMPGALAQGLIWAIMAIGVYLTFRILDVADLTVDGTLGLGGAVCIMVGLFNFTEYPAGASLDALGGEYRTPEGTSVWLADVELEPYQALLVKNK